MEKNDAKKRLLIGVVILTVGSLILSKNLGFFEGFINEYIFRWEMILITMGLIGIISHEGRGPGFIMLAVGGALYLKNQYHLPYGINFWQLFLAAMLIIGGLAIIFRRKRPIHCERKSNAFSSSESSDSDMIDEVAVFGGGDRTIISPNFKGGRILAVFGGSNFNLSRSKLAPGKNYIDVLAVFGGMKLIVPEDWDVTISAVSIFGGFSDKHRIVTPNKANPECELIIKGFLIFGGGEIKSY